MKSENPFVSVVITAHAEKPRWLERAVRSVVTQQDAPPFELIVIADKATEEVRAKCAELLAQEQIDRFEVCDAGDLGTARNLGVSMSTARFVCFLDGDDMFGCHWLRQAYDHARKLEEEGTKDFLLHPEFNVFFGAQNFMHRHISDDSPEFDAKDCVQYNPWSALAFAPKTVLERFPYRKAGDGIGYEDYMINMETLGAGVAHRVVPDSMHAIRMKLDQTSMAARYVSKDLVIPRMPLFDRRDLPDAKEQPEKRRSLPHKVYEQVAFAHGSVGERQLLLHPDMTIRQYPRSRCWQDIAFLRDAIGDAKHVVLVDTLQRGGAEKYGCDWAHAVASAGHKVVVIETEPAGESSSPWSDRAPEGSVLRWTLRTPGLTEEERIFALKRALIQADLTTVLVCNSKVGWGIVRVNPQPIARRVYAASFATIPIGPGMESCPPFFLREHSPNFRIITDNYPHADKLRAFDGTDAIVIPPKCDYAGPSKRSQITKKRLRVLWAGRGSPEKNPNVLPAVAALLEDKADIHVWGDVKAMNGPESLKYRGPFDGFASIDGAYDCYLMTSITEGMPNTALEAVMADLPVVGPKVGGIPEIATRTYSGNSPDDIARAILSAMSGTAVVVPKSIVELWRDGFANCVKELVSL